MLFNSFHFIFFFIFIAIAFWISAPKYRWILLLIASYFFYMSWEPTYIVLIIFTTLVDYFICIHLTNSKNKRTSKVGLALSVAQGLGVLFLFKYYDFFQSILVSILEKLAIDYTPSHFNILLPVGISFYTFQALSYSIDVYRGTIEPERHLGKFALFISFFPQLVAGPIERAKDLLPQLQKNDQKFNPFQFKEGVILFFWGLFKKVVIADNAGFAVEYIFWKCEFQSGESLLVAMYLFAFQVYGDFSGYSDMAVGTSKMLGYELTTNFKQPYFSTSLTDFWRRWHISLSNWFKDYVYIPLGGNKGSKLKQHRNIILTMFLAGIWHGASWHMALWGLLNGLLLSIEKLLSFIKIKKSTFISILRIFVTFNLYCFSLIVFRSESVSQSLQVMSKISQITLTDLRISLFSYKDKSIFTGLILLLLVEILFRNRNITEITRQKKYIRYTFYIILVLSIILLGSSSGKEFFYFQF